MNKIFRIVWSQATQSWVVVSELTKAHKKQSSSNSQGSAVKFSGNFIKSSAIALALLSGHSAYAAVSATGTGNDDAVAFGPGSNAPQARAIAIGKGATISSGQDTIAIGTDTNVQGHSSIVIGKNAKTTNGAEGTVVIGLDAFSEGSGNGGRPNTVVGRGAYTAFGENGTYRLNAATALGFQAGAGLRTDPKNGNKLINNETNADNNAEVLVKAGYGLDEKAPADTKAALQGGNVNNNLTFYRRKHINEATAIGAEARAIGDQSIAIGGQVVAGDGVVALGGNDTDQLRNNKYQVVTDEAVKKTTVGTIDDYNLAYTESTNTVAGQYDKLVGRGMPTAYKSTYGQSGSVVIGMEAHSTTALGTAIGTNSVVRMGAFGATAIGAGSTVQPNAEAAVAIGMGSVANGAYALAGGTASWADYGDIALGYQAKATGKDGAIAMGRATNAQGDSSIMIGGANIKSASAQTIKYQKATGGTTSKDVTETINGAPVTRHY
ncbi:MAG: ESPR-type extended signal peptide-containing protein, partial [Haemophilus parainfluenzae]|nr:ESPR-type extended signal peptide-containing protein [Haemophilus parainfluenzae]